MPSSIATTQATMMLTSILGKRYTQEFLSTVDKWIRCSGEEWTAKRLKAYLTAAKQLRAGNPSIVQSIYRSESIEYCRASMLPKHRVFKMVFNTIQSTQKASVLKRMFAVLRLYTVIQMSECSSNQKSNSIATITCKPQWKEVEMEMLVKELGRLAKRELLPLREDLKSLNIRRLKPYTSTYCSNKLSSDILDRPYGRAVGSLVSTCFVPGALMEKLTTEQLDFLAIIRSGMMDEETTGKLAFLSERGAKCRTVAVPNAWIQLLMEPLHAELDRLSKLMPWSVVHDQNRGAYFCKSALESNSEVWCFDLSSATDLFPLPLQVELLRSLNLSEYADALQEITVQWAVGQTRDNYSGALVDYGSGQPMGLYGSFPLFHLTHGLLLSYAETLASVQGGVRIKDSFRVLGDDVIIINSSVAEMYKTLLYLCKVPISATKSVHSSRLSEFAGFLGVKTRDSVAMFRPYKFGNQGTSGGILNQVDMLGCKARNLPSKWGRWYEIYVRTMSWRNPDLSPLIASDGKPGLLPDKIDKETLVPLITHLLESNDQLIVNLDYEFGSPDAWNWHQVIEEFAESLLGEQTSVRSTDYALLSEVKKQPRQDITDDPLIREEIKNLRSKEDPQPHGYLDEIPDSDSFG